MGKVKPCKTESHTEASVESAASCQIRLSKFELYRGAVKAWLRNAVKEPEGMLAGSLWFWLACLPVVTYGPARLALVYYMGRRCEGKRVKWRDALRFGFRVKAWFMGAGDFLALAMAGGSAYALLEMPLPLLMRGMYALVLILDLLYVMSGVYRYPALAQYFEEKTDCHILPGRQTAQGRPELYGQPETQNRSDPRTPPIQPNQPGTRPPDVGLRMLMLRGFLMCIGNLAQTLLFGCVRLLFFILCAATGAGLILLYPAGAVMLDYLTYNTMVRVYMTVNDVPRHSL